MTALLLIAAVLLALAIALVAYRVIAELDLPQRSGEIVFIGFLIAFGLLGLEAAVIQTLVERL